LVFLRHKQQHPDKQHKRVESVLALVFSCKISGRRSS